MNGLLYIQYPTWIHPELFPGVPVLGIIRWYGLMYIFAFATAYLLLRKQMKEGALDAPGYKCNEDDLFSFLATGILFLLVGARIFSTLVYDTSGLYWHKPWLIFWPFDTETGKFTGLAGMSYHGGFIGGILGIVIWCLWHKKSIWQWLDAISAAIPLGYTFGRLGNFLNGELYGRITTAPWGMVFPRAATPGESFSASLQWVQEFAAECGMQIQEGARFVNLPRHPSQLYEAFLEGIVLWVILWSLRKHKPFNGFISALYSLGYGLFRFILEYFRQPDVEIGYRISKDGSDILYKNTSLLNISTGQILCFLMILTGIFALIGCYFWDKHLKKTTPEKQASTNKNSKKKS